jgi:hypothetical protein
MEVLILAVGVALIITMICSGQRANIWGRHEDRYRRPASIRSNFHDPGGKKERLVGARYIRSRRPDGHRLGAGHDPAAGVTKPRLGLVAPRLAPCGSSAARTKRDAQAVKRSASPPTSPSDLLSVLKCLRKSNGPQKDDGQKIRG